jgi:hypothetical protein
MTFARRLPIVLPSIHLVLFLFTMITGGRYGNPFFCVDLPLSLPLVARDDARTILVVGILGTAWWYFIGQIGWSSKQRTISRVASGLGAFLVLVDVAVYIVALGLLTGGIMSGIYAAGAASRSRGA